MVQSSLPLSFLVVKNGIDQVLSALSKTRHRGRVEELLDATGADGGIAWILARHTNTGDEFALVLLGLFGSRPEGFNLADGHFLHGWYFEDTAFGVERHDATTIATLVLLFFLDRTVAHCCGAVGLLVGWWRAFAAL